MFGKSMVLHTEPVAEVRAFLDERAIAAVVMYDMAHVLGLVGPHFQEPFKDGADLVTGSTHKTFFGTQRGVVAGDMSEDEDRAAAVGVDRVPGVPRVASATITSGRCWACSWPRTR